MDTQNMVDSALLELGACARMLDHIAGIMDEAANDTLPDYISANSVNAMLITATACLRHCKQELKRLHSVQVTP